jgi:integrase
METEIMPRRSVPITTRAEWHKSESGCWSLSLGERGCRVRVMQRVPGGEFAREMWIPGRGRSWASLKTSSRVEARRRAEAFLRALVEGEKPLPAPPLTLGELWTRYQQEAPAYRANTERTQSEKAARAELLMLGFGARARVEALTVAEVERYSELRRRGTGWPDGRTTSKVRARAVAADLQLLRTMVRWACTVRRPDGSWLLSENPLRGLRLPRELNVRRPIATHDRFLVARAKAQELAAEASERERPKWIRLELALVLAEATGRRIGAIAALRWADVRFDPAEIHWRAQFDKKRRDQRVPVPDTLAGELKSFRAKLGAFDGGWLFPTATGEAHWSKDMLSELLRHIEREAKLPKLEGGLWHPYRRKWATERKHLPAVDVMRAGGWADRTTMETCYQQSDEAAVLEVMASPARLVSRKA